MTDATRVTESATVGHQARIIHLSLVGGVLMFAGVAFVLSRSGMVPLVPDLPIDARLLLWLWVGFALTSAIAAIAFWRMRVDPILGDRAAGSAPAGTSERATRILASLIVCWALVETPCLLGLVLFLLSGDWTFFACAIAFALIGFALVAPKPDWFRAAGSRR
jgi:hypothetical protein